MKDNEGDSYAEEDDDDYCPDSCSCEESSGEDED